MVSPNWRSDDDPDYTPDFAKQSGKLDFANEADPDIEELREELEDIADE
jgi:hypothetical protein